jgi:hypothetical protein
MTSTPSYWTPTGSGGPARPPRFAGPSWRIPGAIVSWVLFMFGFTLLYISASILTTLGGFCASGGPYVIQTQCPDTLIWAFPAGFFAVFISWGLAFLFQKGFAAPVLVWGWPILFVGLGIGFFQMIPLGGVFVGLLCGILFLIMGLAPLIFELRAGPRRIVLGKTNVRDQRFTEKEGAPRTVYAFGREDPGVTVAPTPGDWLLSLVVTIGSIAVGVVLGILAITPWVLLGVAR